MGAARSKGKRGGGGKKRGRLGRFFMGEEPSMEQVQRLSPQAQQSLGEIRNWISTTLREQPEAFPSLMQILTGVSEGGELMGTPPVEKLPELDFGPIAQKARTRFREETLPTIAERFASMGRGVETSPGFTGSLARAGEGLEESLAALEAQLAPQYALQRAQYGLERGKLGLAGGELGLRHAQAKHGAGTLRQRMLPGMMGAAFPAEFDTLAHQGRPGFLQNLFKFGGQALGKGISGGITGLFS